MPKMVEDGQIQVAGQRFNLHVKPDVFDGRDLEYRPKIPMLPPEQAPDLDALVLTQVGHSCTGHALAAVINTARSAALRASRSGPFATGPSAAGTANPGKTRRTRKVSLPPAEQVSPYMLYALARRYDEFPGTADAGSSLRGALKGWFHHGAVGQDLWPNLDTPMPDLDDDAFRQVAARMPLGAFYRVNPYRLDDMQSAITELNAVAASAVVHGGWEQPTVMRKGKRTMHVIDRRIDAPPLGGHAFALVGYNEVGFIVQNSWGSAWGDRGFAVLPYEDWLESAYDAWVARPGVPAAKLYVTGWENDVREAGGRLTSVPGPEWQRLTRYVVNLGNGGRLSDSGRFISTPGQVDQVLEHMAQFHDQQSEAHLMLYAHGGLVSERDGLLGAQKHLNWWLNNGVYPVTLAWQSGPGETLYSQLADLFGPRLPAGGPGLEMVEQFDRLVEGVASRLLRWMWTEMKENARACADQHALHDPQDAPGATLLLHKLAQVLKRPAYRRKPLHLHLLGHSAGSILLGALLPRLAELGVPVQSMQLLAPAMTTEEFNRVVLPHLPGTAGSGLIQRLAIFTLTEQDELDDVCTYAGITPYHKSLLYLVSRALEHSGQEVPLLGMAKFHHRPLLPGGQSLAQFLQDVGGVIVTRGASTEADALTDARSHGAFDDDKPTMTSALLRALNRKTVTGHEYTPNAALITGIARTSARQAAAPSKASVALTTPTPGGGPPIAAAFRPGQRPLADTAERPVRAPQPPVPQAPEVDEVAAPATQRVIIDRMARNGWTEMSAAPITKRKARKTGKKPAP